MSVCLRVFTVTLSVLFCLLFLQLRYFRLTDLKISISFWFGQVFSCSFTIWLSAHAFSPFIFQSSSHQTSVTWSSVLRQLIHGHVWEKNTQKKTPTKSKLISKCFSWFRALVLSVYFTSQNLCLELTTWPFVCCCFHCLLFSQMAWCMSLVQDETCYFNFFHFENYVNFDHPQRACIL